MKILVSIVLACVATSLHQAKAKPSTTSSPSNKTTVTPPPKKSAYYYNYHGHGGNSNYGGNNQVDPYHGHDQHSGNNLGYQNNDPHYGNGQGAGPYGNPQAGPYNDPHGNPQADPYNNLHGNPQAGPYNDPHGNPQADPYTNLHGNPQAGPYNDPHGNPQADPYNNLHGNPQAGPYNDPHGNHQADPNDYLHGNPQAGPYNDPHGNHQADPNDYLHGNPQAGPYNDPHGNPQADPYNNLHGNPHNSHVPYNTGHGSGYGFNQFHGPICPNQTNYHDVDRLSADPTGYPGTQIADELTNRPDLSACLARQVSTDADFLVPTDPNLGHTKDICPSYELRLYSYLRDVINGRCWIIQNVQSIFTLVECLFHKCSNCENIFASNKENHCIKKYQIFGIYAYCEDLVLNSRIIYDKVLIPTACHCTQVNCYKDY